LGGKVGGASGSNQSDELRERTDTRQKMGEKMIRVKSKSDHGRALSRRDQKTSKSREKKKKGGGNVGKKRKGRKEVSKKRPHSGETPPGSKKGNTGGRNFQGWHNCGRKKNNVVEKRGESEGEVRTAGYERK